jgi:quercetin dioxygenase-like cupin family protein
MPVLRPSLHVRLIPFRVVSLFEFRCFSVWHSRHDEGESPWKLNGAVRSRPARDQRIGSQARSALTRCFRLLNQHGVCNSVTFEPGARTAWHTHPLGQILIVTFGCGWVQREGGPVEEIRPGDVVWFSPEEKHWHGATPTTGMTHIAIQEALNGKPVDWMEHVSDEQYRR